MYLLLSQILPLKYALSSAAVKCYGFRGIIKEKNNWTERLIQIFSTSSQF